MFLSAFFYLQIAHLLKVVSFDIIDPLADLVAVAHSLHESNCIFNCKLCNLAFPCQTALSEHRYICANFDGPLRRALAQIVQLVAQNRIDWSSKQVVTFSHFLPPSGPLKRELNISM